MAAIIFEKWNSRRMQVSVERSAMEFLYVVTGSDQEDDVRALLEATLAPTYTGLDGLTLIFQEYDISYLGNLNWDVVAHYSTHYPRGNGSLPFPQETSIYSFELSQQAVKRTQSLQTVKNYGISGAPGSYAAQAGAAPDCLGAIGCNGDSVEGVDVNTPVFTWSETWWIPKVQITQAYIDAIYSLASTPVCNAPFRNRDAGEVLFLGASGSERDDANFEITFRFAASPNVRGSNANLPNGSDVAEPITLVAPDGTQCTTVYDKDGWDYLWFRYQDMAPSGTGVTALIKQPVACYVEKVYMRGDFSQLGIGT